LYRQVTEQLTGAPRKQLLGTLQALWIAHDILGDAVTRTDYDFRRMGLRGQSSEDDPAKATLTSRPKLRIGELLQCAGLLETTELEIAADMHKAMPELMFGAFLVKQGFIGDGDLNCVLLGQQLLKTGGITVAQFQDAMIERATTGGDVGPLLVARHYLTESELQEAYKGQSEATQENIPIFSSTVSLQASELDVAEALNSTDDESESHYQAESQSESAAGAQASWESETTNATPEILDLAAKSSTADLLQPEEYSADQAAAPADESDIDRSALEKIESRAQTIPPNELAAVTPRLNMSNAVPAWKDQLDWSTPEDVQSLAADAPAESVSLASLYQTKPSRSDTVDLAPQFRNQAANESQLSETIPPLSSETVEAERKPRRSLLDLMVGLDNIEPKKEEEVQKHSVLSNFLQGSATAGDAAPPQTVDDFTPPMLDEEDISAVADEFAALDAAAKEALDIENHAAPAVSSGGATPGEDEQTQTISPETQLEVRAVKELPDLNLPDLNLPDRDLPDFRLAPNVVAAQAASAAREAAREAARDQAQVSADMQKESGSWQIVSIPASALASLLLDEDEEQAEYQAKNKAVEAGKKVDEPPGKNPPGGTERRSKRRKTRS